MTKSTYSIEVRGDGSLHLKDQSNDGPEKIVRVPDELGKDLAHLNLHGIDLQIAKECLDELDERGYPGNGGHIIDQCLWNSALVFMFKCFGRSNARSSLDRDTIYASEQQRATFNYWKSLRNKNIVHDDNDVTQSLVVAVLRRRIYEPKIDNVYVLTRSGTTVAAVNTTKVRDLVEKAQKWVAAETSRLRPLVIDALEAMTYDDVDAMPPACYSKTTDQSIHATRLSPPR